MDWLTPGATVLVGITTAIIGWVTARTKVRADKEAAAAPEWDMFVARQEAWITRMERERQQLVEMVEGLEMEQQKLKDRVHVLEEQARVAEQERDAAIAHIGEWRAAHPKDLLQLPYPIRHYFEG